MQGPLSTQRPGSGVLSESSKGTGGRARRCFTPGCSPLAPLCQQADAPLTAWGERRAKRAPPSVPCPGCSSPRPTAGVSRHLGAGGGGHRTPPSAALLARCSPAGSQGPAPSAASSCPELPVSTGQARHIPRWRGPQATGPAPLWSTHPHPDPSRLRPHTAPAPQDHFKSDAPASWGEEKTLAFPATLKIAPTIEKHLIFQETDGERMLVSLSS